MTRKEIVTNTCAHETQVLLWISSFYGVGCFHDDAKPAFVVERECSRPTISTSCEIAPEAVFILVTSTADCNCNFFDADRKLFSRVLQLTAINVPFHIKFCSCSQESDYCS